MGVYLLPCIVTTSLRAGAEQVELAARISEQTGLPLVERGKKSISGLAAEWNARAVIVVKADKVTCIMGEKEFFFHPGLAGLRIKEIKRGKTDQMIDAMALKPGHEVLDCTLGLGTDAIVASYFVGKTGRVVGLESSVVLALLVRMGMQLYKDARREVIEAMRRIVINNADHYEILAGLPENSYDVVYFDPMFRVPRMKSCSINAFRMLADDRPLTPKVIRLALRVARRRVVVKENRAGNELKRLGFQLLTGGKNSAVAYGIMQKGV